MTARIIREGDVLVAKVRRQYLTEYNFSGTENKEYILRCYIGETAAFRLEQGN